MVNCFGELAHGIAGITRPVGRKEIALGGSEVRVGGEELVYFDGFKFSLYAQARKWSRGEVITHGAGRGLAEQGIRAEFLVRRLEARGEVHGIAEDGVVSFP